MSRKTVTFQVAAWLFLALLLLAPAIGERSSQCGYNSNALEMECGGD